MTERIAVNPKILCGKPVIKGTRIPVSLILELLSAGYDSNRIIDAYPSLTAEGIKAVDLLSGYNNMEFVIQGGGELSPHLITNAVSNEHARIKVINKIVSRKEVINELTCADVLLLPLKGWTQ